MSTSTSPATLTTRRRPRCSTSTLKSGIAPIRPAVSQVHANVSVYTLDDQDRQDGGPRRVGRARADRRRPSRARQAARRPRQLPRGRRRPLDQSRPERQVRRPARVSRRLRRSAAAARSSPAGRRPACCATARRCARSRSATARTRSRSPTPSCRAGSPRRATAPTGSATCARAVEKATGGALKASQVIVQSDHSHSGPDLLGVWGGAPAAYRGYVVKQTVDAIVEACEDAQARRALLRHRARPRPALQPVRLRRREPGDGLRRARPAGPRRPRRAVRHAAELLRPRDRARLEQHEGHAATGSRRPTACSRALRRQGADRGRHARPHAARRPRLPRRRDHRAGAAGHLQRSTTTPRASSTARPTRSAAPKRLDGHGQVVAATFTITDPSSNPLLLGLLYGGAAAGMPVNRSMTPPWMTGNMIGTVTTSARIGDVLLQRGPGEMYPQIPLKVRELMPGLRGYMTAGLADDQLGYLIAPLRGLSRADPPLVLQPARRRGQPDRQRQLLLQRLAHDGRARDVLAAARARASVRPRERAARRLRPLRGVRQRRRLVSGGPSARASAPEALGAAHGRRHPDAGGQPRLGRRARRPRRRRWSA